MREMPFLLPDLEVERQIEQLELKLEELEASQAELAPEPPPQTSIGEHKSTPRKETASTQTPAARSA